MKMVMSYFLVSNTFILKFVIFQQLWILRRAESSIRVCPTTFFVVLVATSGLSAWPFCWPSGTCSSWCSSCTGLLPPVDSDHWRISLIHQIDAGLKIYKYSFLFFLHFNLSYRNKILYPFLFLFDIAGV